MLEATPNAKIVCAIEHYRADGETDLDKSLAFTVENLGDVDALLTFDGSSLAVPIHVSKGREFEFLGVRYSGTLQVVFDKATTGTQPLVTILKRALVCG